MESAELPCTASGVLRICNYTRYNTDDLLALLNAVEAAIPSYEKKGGVPTLGNSIQRVSVTDIEPVVTFKVFTGVPRENASSHGKGRVVHSRRLMAAQRWRYPLEMRCIPPEKLHMNPMAALTAAGDGVELLPQHMVEELVERFCGFYAYWGYQYGKQTPDKPSISGLQVRVESKRAASAPKRTKRTVALERIERARQEASYRLPSHTKAVDNLRDLARRINAVAEAAELDTDPLMAKLKTLVDATDAFHKELQEVTVSALKEVT